MRKLVTLRKIDELRQIEGADKIELAILGGWQSVVSKGEHKEGELVLYYEIDSFLPIEEPYLFLKDRCYKKLPDGSEGLRLKTIKLKKQVSQGLVVSLNKFTGKTFNDLEKDYSEDLGVEKYEPPVPAQLAGRIKGNFPTHLVPKTDEERIQNLSEWFNKYKDVAFEKTLKFDGTSLTIIYHKESEDPFMMCSRNLMLDTEIETTYTKMNSVYDFKGMLETLGLDLAIQGELIGEGIQKNKLAINGQDFYVFNIYDIAKQSYLTSEERVELCAELGLNHVDVIDDECYPLKQTMQELIADATNARYGDKKGEGYVYKSTTKVEGRVVSFKVINNKYLLSGDD